MNRDRFYTLIGIAVFLVLLVMGYNWGEVQIAESMARGYSSDFSLFERIFFWGVGFVVSIWKVVNWPTNWLLGDNLIDLTIELMFFAGFALVIAGLVAIPMKLAVLVFRRKIGFTPIWVAVALVVALILVVPHLYMSWTLREYKREFKTRAMGSSSVLTYATENDPGELDYGGKLDELVGIRVYTLAKHQYIPYFTAIWHTNGMGSTVGGAYIYTFLSEKQYNDLLFRTLALFADFKTPQEREKGRLEFLSELEKPIPTLK